MKAFLTFLLLLPLAVFGQNWSLVTSSSRYNITSTQQTTVPEKAVWVTLSSTLRGDSFFVTSPRRMVTYFSYPYALLVGSILADTVYKRAAGVYECRYIVNPEASNVNQRPFRLHTLAEPGIRWIFRDTVSARVLSKQAITLWGQSDSVKIIRLGTGDTIRLSKQFGLLQWGKDRVIGLQHHKLGVQIPRTMDLYNWQPGDVYFFTAGSSSQSFSSRTESDFKYTVLSEERTDKTLAYRVRLQSKNKEINQLAGTEKVSYKDTLMLFTVDRPLSTRLPGTIYNGSGLEGAEYTKKMTDTALVLTISPIIIPSSGSRFQQSWHYVMGVGLVSKSTRFIDISYASSSSQTLVAYQRKDGRMFGIPPTDPFFSRPLSTQNEKAALEIRVWPNPATDILNIQTVVAVPRIELYNAATGQLVLSDTSPRGTIDVPALPAGMYVLKVCTAEGVGSKLVVIR